MLSTLFLYILESSLWKTDSANSTEKKIFAPSETKQLNSVVAFKNKIVKMQNLN